MTISVYKPKRQHKNSVTKLKIAVLTRNLFEFVIKLDMNFSKLLISCFNYPTMAQIPFAALWSLNNRSNSDKYFRIVFQLFSSLKLKPAIFKHSREATNVLNAYRV